MGHSLLVLCCHARSRRLSNLLPLLLLRMRELLLSGLLLKRQRCYRLLHSRLDRHWCCRDGACGHARV